MSKILRLTLLLIAGSLIVWGIPFVNLQGHAATQPAFQSASPSYDITDLGVLDGIGDIASDPSDINDLGQVVGTSNPSNHGFFYVPGTGMIEIPPPPNASVPISRAVGINNAGQVVGYALPTGSDRTYIWTRSGGLTFPLPDESPSSESTPQRINDSGEVVGSIRVNNHFHAYAWTPGQQLIDLNNVISGSASSVAVDVNESGQVIGGFGTAFVIDQSFIYTPGQGVTDPFLTGDSVGPVNDLGQIVGHRDTTNNGIIYTPGQGLTEIQRPAGTFSLVLTDINNCGQVVGNLAFNSTGFTSGIIYSPSAGLRDLNDLTPANSGYRISAAWAINDLGQIAARAIVSGLGRAVVLTPRRLPLVFVPGIAASRLDRTDEPAGEIWFGSILPKELNRWDQLTLDPKKDQAQISSPDVLRRVSPAPFPDEIVYENFLNWLHAQGYREQSEGAAQQNLFIFKYDWRKSNVENSILLGQFVQQIRQYPEYQNSDVDVIAHSMGGILTRRYILNHPGNHHVHKLISVGTPWLGAPKLINVLETGDFLEKPFLGYTDKFKALAEFFHSAHQLAPSRAYFSAAGGHPLNINGIDYTYDQYIDWLDEQHPHPGSLPGTTNDYFHTQPGQDDFANDTSGVGYYHIAGFQTSQRTITQVRIRRSLSPTIVYGNGDGTVPIISAFLPPALRGSVTQFVVTGPNDQLTEHTGMLDNDQVHRKIIEYLIGCPSPLATVPQPTITNVQEDYYLSISGPSQMQVADTIGNTLSITSTLIFGSIPDVTPVPLGQNASQVIIPTGQTYHIMFMSEMGPVTIELTRGDGSSPAEATRYLDVVLPPNRNALLTITPSGPDLLRYDSDDDGTYDTQVNPTVSVTGPAAMDISPPMVSFSATVQGQSNVIVNISAQDSASGVRAIFYSLDGTTFQPYVAPISVNPAQIPEVFAYADDNVANRSGIETYRVAPAFNSFVRFFAASGGTGSLGVTSPAGLNWTANSNVAWLMLSSPSGTGDGAVSFTVSTNSAGLPRVGMITLADQTFTVKQGAQFNDVPATNIFYTEIGKLSASGLTAGCSNGLYCPQAAVTREQMAVFIMRALGVFNPPTPTTQRFQDVGPERFGYAFIDALARYGITLGCGGGNYCPDAPVTREQMAAFIERAVGVFEPPMPTTQRFTDVPPTNIFYAFIDDFAQRGITLGCGPGIYCPNQPVTREQMAAFLVRAFINRQE